ncbi:hypothetical protein EVAR_3253_1 [Eumeta japonica]|uniref:Uncharacterized protein n=1 Tax=Eumeta variegata TaxID=151549 RepID=A0A4C1SVL8_EUMVA|nr:hypothetical protein EVAR_3253_1 [Eumeta japonica]
MNECTSRPRGRSRERELWNENIVTVDAPTERVTSQTRRIAVRFRSKIIFEKNKKLLHTFLLSIDVTVNHKHVEVGARTRAPNVDHRAIEEKKHNSLRLAVSGVIARAGACRVTCPPSAPAGRGHVCNYSVLAQKKYAQKVRFCMYSILLAYSWPCDSAGGFNFY